MNGEINTCDCKGCELKSLFFENIEDKELKDICNTKKEVFYPKGTIITNEGDEIKDFHYLKTGLVKLAKKLTENKSQIIKFARPLDFVSILSIFSDKYYQYSVIAIEDSTICSIDLNLIKNIALQNGKFTLDLLKRMSQTSDDIINTFLEIRRRNLRGRIAYVLLYFSSDIYNNNVFDLPVSRKEIAELIEMTTENVIRIFSEFRKDGIISINGKTIEILNTEMLKKISDLG